MSLPVILRPAADADIQTTHDELEQARAGLGDRFIDRVGEVLARIESMREMYGLAWQDLRAVRLRKFRHLVDGVVFAHRVEVLAVMHGSREASAWQSRVSAGRKPGNGGIGGISSYFIKQLGTSPIPEASAVV